MNGVYSGSMVYHGICSKKILYDLFGDNSDTPESFFRNDVEQDVMTCNLTHLAHFS